jgi:hypothetical protein
MSGFSTKISLRLAKSMSDVTVKMTQQVMTK